jgi:hypothetical protein
MLSFSTSLWDLIKFPYFGETTERAEEIRDEREGDFMDQFIILSLFWSEREKPLTLSFMKLERFLSFGLGGPFN